MFVDEKTSVPMDPNDSFPSLGRFVEADPIGYEGGPNLYAYVGNDPINWVDPLGLDETPGATVTAPSCHGNGILVLPEGRSDSVGWFCASSFTSGANLTNGMIVRGGGGGGFPPCTNIILCRNPAVIPSADCNVVNNYCRPVPPPPTPRCPAIQPPTPPASRSYPVPPGYSGANIRNNLYVRDSGGKLALNPYYEKAFRESGGVNWTGVTADLTKIAAQSVLPLRSPGSMVGAWGLPTGAGAKTFYETSIKCPQ
jgi:hypothetical protein